MHLIYIKDKIIINRLNAKSWAYNIKKRDEFACILCDSTENIEAHHIERWVDSPRKRKFIGNGVTLCKKCHLAIHNNKREKPNLEKTYELICKLKEYYKHVKGTKQRKEILEHLNILACDIGVKMASLSANKRPKTFLIKR